MNAYNLVWDFASFRVNEVWLGYDEYQTFRERIRIVK